MRIENHDERNFYEIEATQQNWSVRELNRQVGSSLYERLALSRNKEEVLRLAKEGQTVEKPSDIIKNPITLEFLGLKTDAIYSESKLENAIISKMQQFLLELGKGFLFEARQKRCSRRTHLAKGCQYICFRLPTLSPQQGSVASQGEGMD